MNVFMIRAAKFNRSSKIALYFTHRNGPIFKAKTDLFYWRCVHHQKVGVKLENCITVSYCVDSFFKERFFQGYLWNISWTTDQDKNWTWQQWSWSWLVSKQGKSDVLLYARFGFWKTLWIHRGRLNSVFTWFYQGCFWYWAIAHWEAVTHAKYYSEFCMPKYPLPNCQWPIAKAAFIELRCNLDIMKCQE